MIILVFGSLPVSGQLPPTITVAPVWRPAAQLTTVDSIGAGYPLHDAGDEYMYVDAELRVTTTVQFWAAQFNCTVPPAILDSYVQNGSVTDPGDDVAMIVPGIVWGTPGSQFVQINSNFNPASGQMGATLARMNSSSTSPLGTNGTSSQLLLATLHYRVKPQALNFVGTAALTCTFSFLNRNGVAVAAPVVQAPPALSVRYGYGISGVVTYQARTAHAGIGVICDWRGDAYGTGNDPTGVTAANGTFNLNNVRKLGLYDCYYYGNASTSSAPPVLQDADTYLTSIQSVFLDENLVSFLPVALRLGDVERSTSPSAIDNLNDIALVTTHFNNLTNVPLGALWATPYINGDANGDRKTNSVDLTVVGANLGFSSSVLASHLITSSAVATPLNNRVWLTTEPVTLDNSPFVGTQQFVPGTSSDYWPALSPNGKMVTFVRRTGTGSATRYVLYAAPVTNGVVGAPLRLTPATGWLYDDFAPSWSDDGQRIAFVCSRFNSAGAQDWMTDKGNLCMVDASGRNLTVKSAVTMHIYPPAWFVLSSGVETILFGGVTGLPGCGFTLCRYAIEANAVAVFDADIPASGADMPSMNVVNGVRALFYRYNDGVNRRLRFAEINGTDGVDAFEAVSSAVSPFHFEVSNAVPVPINNAVDWYTIASQDRDILFTEYSAGYSVSGCAVRVSAGQVGSNEWSSGAARSLQGWGTCNPTWDGNLATATNLHALRNTADWTP
jgi:hypothetical protein